MWSEPEVRHFARWTVSNLPSWSRAWYSVRYSHLSDSYSGSPRSGMCSFGKGCPQYVWHLRLDVLICCFQWRNRFGGPFDCQDTLNCLEWTTQVDWTFRRIHWSALWQCFLWCRAENDSFCPYSISKYDWLHWNCNSTSRMSQYWYDLQTATFPQQWLVISTLSQKARCPRTCSLLVRSSYQPHPSSLWQLASWSLGTLAAMPSVDRWCESLTCWTVTWCAPRSCPWRPGPRSWCHVCLTSSVASGTWHLSSCSWCLYHAVFAWTVVPFPWGAGSSVGWPGFLGSYCSVVQVRVSRWRAGD